MALSVWHGICKTQSEDGIRIGTKPKLDEVRDQEKAMDTVIPVNPNKITSDRRLSAVAATMLAGIVVSAGPAMAGTFQTFVGYADSLRASPFFPNPFIGSSNVDLFAGQNPGALD